MNTGLNFLFVGLGGAFGACLRYSLSLLLAPHLVRFPYATLLANVTGAFIAGVLATWFLSRGLLGTPLQLLLIVGFLGGFTTFSAFSFETLRLLETSNWSQATLNIALNVVGSILAVTLGASISRLL